MNKKIIFNSINIITIISLLLFAVNLDFSSVKAKDLDSNRKIVVFKEGLSNSEKEAVIDVVGARKIKNLDLVKAAVINVPSKTVLEKLSSNPAVLRIDDDVIVEAAGQVLPWGVNQVDAELVWPLGNTANPIKVSIIDTGTSKNHPDLKNNVKGGVNTISPSKSFSDDNGHGNHVSGIVAAVNNSIGVVGVAHQADLYGVKVLNRYGSGFLSDVIEGIEWSINNGMQVINMSLTTSSDVQSFHDAVTAAKNAGVVVVAAAGNASGPVTFPAVYSEAIAVSATDSSNNIASFSNRGPEIDLAAPGVDILSTYKDSSYAIISETSMSAPHVAGVAALVLNTPVGTYDANLNGKWDPDEVQKKMQDRAVDLGAAGFDNLYGWGIVNAYNAVQP